VRKLLWPLPTIWKTAPLTVSMIAIETISSIRLKPA
jgi:hypothetical protein